MLHILLWILKFIGILLAVLVGILLLAIICVLFVPIRYTVKADGRLLGEEQALHARVKISWLFHILNITFIYPEAAYLRVRIFCFTVFNSSRLKMDDEQKTGRIEPQVKLTESPQGQVETVQRENITKSEESKTVEIVETENKQGIFDRIKGFFQVIINLWKRCMDALKNIQYTIRKIYDRIRAVIENIRYYTDVIKSDVFQRAWQDCKKQLLRILRMLKPSKCKINLLAGTGDPGSTGQLWSVYGILYPLIGNNVFLKTDFENQIVEGDLYIKGKVQMWVLALAAFRLYRDKDIRRLLKMLKREDM